MSFFGKIGAWILALISRIGSGVLAAAQAGLEDIAKNGGKVLMDASYEAAKAAEKQGGTGQEKMAAAIAAVTRVLTVEGFPVVVSAIRRAIELQLPKIK